MPQKTTFFYSIGEKSGLETATKTDFRSWETPVAESILTVRQDHVDAIA